MKIIQITVNDKVLYALTIGGRIFRKSMFDGEWIEIQVPSAKETFIPST